MAFEVSVTPLTLVRYILVRSEGIHGLGTKADALPPRIEPRRPRMDRVCLRLLRCALRFFLWLRLRRRCVRRLALLLLRLALLLLRLTLLLLRLELVRLPLMECLRPDFLVNGILRGIVYTEIITKNNILRRLVRLLYIDVSQHVATATHLCESKFIKDIALGGLRGVFLG
jgi:hypothetical protein